jgi:hypothetical protein
VTREEATRLRAIGCVIGGASLLFLAWGQYQAGSPGWCAGLAVAALCAFAIAVHLRSRP